MNIKVGDTVVVMKGLEKPLPPDVDEPGKAEQRSDANRKKITLADGSTKEYLFGKVMKILRHKNKVMVEGVNMVFKHMKKSRQNPRGGRLRKEMPMQLANVRLLCPACDMPVRTGITVKADGAKFRTCKKCKAEIGQIAKPKKTAAK